MDKKRQIKFNLNNFLLSTSFVQDVFEKDLYNVSKNHSKRVAYLSLKLGQEFGFDAKQLNDLCAYSLVHNIALKKERNYNKDHLEFAQELVNKLPFMCEEKDIIKYHREYYNGSGIFALQNDQIPLFSQIISLANHLEEKFDLSCENIENKAKILEYLQNNKNILFSEDLIKKFFKISSKIDFWLDMENENDILYFIFSSLHDFTIDADFEDVLIYTSIFDSLFDENKGFLDNCSKMADFYDFEHKDKQTFLIAASLKDLGKLAVLGGETKEKIKAYPYYTKKVLDNLMGFSDISIWASRLEETLDGKGYPCELLGKDLSLKDRLMAVLSKYQKETIQTLEKMAKNNEIDKTILRDVVKIL